MKSILKAQSIALVILLLCSVCVVPVLAANQQNNVVEDGVHLIKFDDSPTILDDKYYDLKSNVNYYRQHDSRRWRSNIRDR